MIVKVNKHKYSPCCISNVDFYLNKVWHGDPKTDTYRQHPGIYCSQQGTLLLSAPLRQGSGEGERVNSHWSVFQFRPVLGLVLAKCLTLSPHVCSGSNNPCFVWTTTLLQGSKEIMGVSLLSKEANAVIAGMRQPKKLYSCHVCLVAEHLVQKHLK